MYWVGSHIAVTVSTHLVCVVCRHFCSNVAVPRPWRLSEFTLTSCAPALTGPHFSVYECKGNVGAFPRDKENWPYHSDVKLLYCVNQVRPRCWKCWVHRIILRNFGGRTMNSFLAIICRKRSAFKIKKFWWSLKTCLKDHGDSFGRFRKKDLIIVCTEMLSFVNILVFSNKEANNFETARWIFLKISDSRD